jgi:hypothetical protein
MLTTVQIFGHWWKDRSITFPILPPNVSQKMWRSKDHIMGVICLQPLMKTFTNFRNKDLKGFQSPGMLHVPKDIM